MSRSPGEYQKEKDLSQRIRAVSSSIGAIVLASDKGPINTCELITNKQELISMFGKPDIRISKGHYAAIEFLKQSSRLYVTRVANNDPSAGEVPLTAGLFFSVDDASAKIPVPHLNNFDDGKGNAKGMYDPFNSYTWNPNRPGIKNVLFFACAANPGKWNDDIYVEVCNSKKPLTADFDPAYDDPTVFIVNVYMNYRSSRQAPDESFTVSMRVERNGFGEQMFIEDVINSNSSIIRVRANPYAAENVKILSDVGKQMEGGSRGGYVNYTQVMAGWKLYSNPEHIDVNILFEGGAPVGTDNLQDIADIQRTMTELAESRMDCIAILDIPEKMQETADAVSYRRNDQNIDSSYAALYAPYVKIRDTYTDRDVWLPPSGFVAAAYAYTDENYDLWKAPAGMYRGDLDVKESRYVYNQGHRDALNDANINPIRYFPDGSGYKIWGAETEQSMASALSYVPVRRLLNYIEKSISIALRYSVFDPNSQTLRSRLTAIVRSFLQPIMDAEGLYWYAVICDDTNNTAETIAAGELYLDVYVDPVIPAKRIFLNAKILKTGATYKESAA